MVKTEQITISVSEELKKKVEVYCEKEMIPVAQYIRNLITKDIEEKQEEL